MAPEQKNFSRREFLKTGVVGGVFLAEILSSKTAIAALEELLTTREFISETYEAGLSRLRKDVFEKETERFYAFVKKGNKVGWLNVEDVMTVDLGKSINLLPILSDAGVDTLHFVHTHPLFIAKLDRLLPVPMLEAAKKNKRTNFPLMPSSTDILTLAMQKAYVKEHGMRYSLKHSVLDPAGIWEYDVDISNPSVAKAIKSMKEAEKDSARIKPDDELLSMQPHESFMTILGLELYEQQQLFYKGLTGIAPAKMKNLENWAKNKWGVRFNFKSFEESPG